MTLGAIILCGGRSARMGRDKATLPFGRDETMLRRIVRVVAEVVPCERIVCVAAIDQSLPNLPALVRVLTDPLPFGGPLAGLLTGLATLADEVDAIYATGCDTPLLPPAFVSRMFDLLGDRAAAAPHDGDRWHPLSAVYRTSLLPIVQSLVAAGERRLAALVEQVGARAVSLALVRDVDPELRALAACNTQGEYQAALNCLKNMNAPQRI
jgi:molybdopterin-guanine dinucleotide biosynthesis protein A